MAGQHSIFENNRENLFNKHNKCLIKQVDLWYIKDKFAIETEYDEKKALHEYLLKEVYKTEDCEVLDFMDKKLKGVLENECITIAELKTV